MKVSYVKPEMASKFVVVVSTGNPPPIPDGRWCC